MESDYIPRQSQDQPWINRLAKHYLTAQETSLLCRFLGCTPEQVRIDAKEHQKLSQTYPEFFNLSKPNAIHALYLFVFTIDRYLRHVRQLWFTVQNLQDLDAEKQDELDHEILAPDFRLWPLVDAKNPTSLPGSTYQENSDLKRKQVGHMAYDEMCLLFHPCIHLLTGLAQGLFMVDKYGNWVNAGETKELLAGVRRPDFFTGLCYFGVPICGALKDYFNFTPFLLSPNEEVFGGWKPPPRGGAIAYFWVEKKTLDGQPTITRRQWDELAKRMKLSGNQWMHFCPRLSDALVNSRVNQDLNSLYNSLQNFYDQKRKVSTIRMEPRNPQDIIQFRNRLSGYQNLFGCGPGMVPRFVSHSGKEVPLRDAVLEHNGMQYINTAIVDPDQSSCTAVIPLKQANQFAALLK